MAIMMVMIIVIIIEYCHLLILIIKMKVHLCLQICLECAFFKIHQTVIPQQQYMIICNREYTDCRYYKNPKMT